MQLLKDFVARIIVSDGGSQRDVRKLFAGLNSALHMHPRLTQSSLPPLSRTSAQLPAALLPAIDSTGSAPPPAGPRPPARPRTSVTGREEEDATSTPEGAGRASLVGGGPWQPGGGAAAAAAGPDAFGRGPGAGGGTLRAAPDGIETGEATLSIFVGMMIPGC
jgi:hypothetical protein